MKRVSVMKLLFSSTKRIVDTKKAGKKVGKNSYLKVFFIMSTQ